MLNLVKVNNKLLLQHSIIFVANFEIAVVRSKSVRGAVGTPTKIKMESFATPS